MTPDHSGKGTMDVQGEATEQVGTLLPQEEMLPFASLHTGTILTMGEKLANCVVGIKEVQAPTLSSGEFEMDRNDCG